MRNALFSFLAFSLLFSPRFSFADTRQEIIDKTLREREANNNGAPVAHTVQVTETTKGPAWPTDIADEREKVIQHAFFIASGYDLSSMHYSEWGGYKLDENYGTHRGFYITLGYMSPHYSEIILGKPFLRAYYRYYGDSLKYKGATSDGTTEHPFNTSQHSKVERYGIKFGAYEEVWGKVQVYPYLDIGKRVWQRGQNEIVDGAYSYAEKYSWVYLGFGAGIGYQVLPRLSLGIEAEAMYALNSRMRADLLEGATFKLRNVWGNEVKTPIKYLLSKNLTFDLTPYFTYWNISSSKPEMISGMLFAEPDSHTHEEGLLTGLTYSF